MCNINYMGYPYDEDIEDGAIDLNEFAFKGNGYYDEEGIWHDPDVEDE